MKYPLRVRPEVPDDVAEAYRWYEGHSEGLGERFLRELKATYWRIALAPEMYAKGEWDARWARMHRFPYLVHFRFTGAEVVVLAMMHGGRDSTAWRNRT
jgi:toxin ParE1/3/4